MSISTISIYAAYDCTDAGGVAGDGSGPKKLLGYFLNEDDAQRVVKDLGWASWDEIRKDGEVREHKALTADGGKTGYFGPESPPVKIHQPFINGDDSFFFLDQALKKLTDKELEALKRHLQ